MDTKVRIYNIVKSIINPLLNNETKLYLKAWYHSPKDRNLFKDVKTYCIFIGTGRSGHTLIASLIDAHPNAVISNELNTLKFVLKGFSYNQVFLMILDNSRRHAEQGKNWTGYSYSVKNQMQGKFTRISVIGDKKAGVSMDLFMENPELLEKIIKKWKVEFKFIHVIRNPYDVISTSARGGMKNIKVTEDLIKENIHRFFKRMEMVKQLKGRFGSLILDIRYEYFIKSPEENLNQILSFLGLSPVPNYLEDCSKIVNSKPSMSRRFVNWSESLLVQVKKESQKYPFLEGYTFDQY